VIPVDYCAEALHLLLDKSTLKYSAYNISRPEPFLHVRPDR
jgi:hypothetical protein